ncbi:MAG: hypothetical protein ACM3XM_08020 [Mycobacterium leprae]
MPSQYGLLCVIQLKRNHGVIGFVTDPARGRSVQTLDELHEMVCSPTTPRFLTVHVPVDDQGNTQPHLYALDWIEEIYAHPDPDSFWAKGGGLATRYM